MEEAYNLWALLYYDLGIEYPPYDLPQGHSKNEPFVFWAADLSILKAQRKAYRYSSAVPETFISIMYSFLYSQKYFHVVLLLGLTNFHV